MKDFFGYYIDIRNDAMDKVLPAMPDNEEAYTFVRFTSPGRSPYNRSTLNTAGNTFDRVSGEGVFCFVVGAPCYIDGTGMAVLTAEMLADKFGRYNCDSLADDPTAHIVDIDTYDTLTSHGKTTVCFL